MYKHVLVAIDFDKGHELIIERAAAIARSFGAKLSQIHVVRHEFVSTAWAPSAAGYGFTGLPTEAEIRKKADAANTKLEALSERYQPKAENKVWIASSVKTAVREAALKQDADLIVIGSHVRNRLERLLFNSAGYQIVREAPCDVLVIDQPNK